MGAQRRSRDALLVDVRFSKLGRRLLWAEGRPSHCEPEESNDGVVQLRYHNGPLLAMAPKVPSPDAAETETTSEKDAGPTSKDGGPASTASKASAPRALARMLASVAPSTNPLLQASCLTEQGGAA